MESVGYGEEVDTMFKILLATDNHLGAHENDGIRGEDSFTTFEEILQLANDHKVDFVLLGGDLFDQNIPSTKCMDRCIKLLRKYCMGDKPITVSFDSNPEEVFSHCDPKVVNYLDPNLNISIPVFSIHGNHDDPSGLGRLSCLDLLSSTGLVNYFGKWTDLNNIVMKPILLSKGSSKLAIYGLSHIRDERLHRLFASKSVQFEGMNGHADRFNLLVLHQNRVERSARNFISEDVIPDFFDFVLWGHEHDCRIDPEENVSKGFVVVQPGSSVATSLCEGEAIPKHVAILKVIGNKYELNKIPLRTVRPFVFENCKISDWNINLPAQKRTEAIQKFVGDYINSKMITRAKRQVTGHKKQPTLPLIRLRLEITEDYQQFNTIRFSQAFAEEVANASSIKNCEVVKLVKVVPRRGRKPEFELNMESIIDDLSNEISVEDIAEKLLDEPENPEESTKHCLSVLFARAMTVGVRSYTDKEDRLALENIVYDRMAKVKALLKEQSVDEENIKETLLKLRENYKDRKQEIEEEAIELLSSGPSRPRQEKNLSVPVDRNVKDSDMSEDDLEIIEEKISPPKRGRGSRGGRTSGTTRGSAANTTARGRGRGRGRASKTNIDNTTMNITRFTSVRPRTIDESTSSFASPSKKAKVQWQSDSSSD